MLTSKRNINIYLRIVITLYCILRYQTETSYGNIFEDSSSSDARNDGTGVDCDNKKQ